MVNPLGSITSSSFSIDQPPNSIAEISSSQPIDRIESDSTDSISFPHAPSVYTISTEETRAREAPIKAPTDKSLKEEVNIAVKTAETKVKEFLDKYSSRINTAKSNHQLRKQIDHDAEYLILYVSGLLGALSVGDTATSFLHENWEGLFGAAAPFNYSPIHSIDIAQDALEGIEVATALGTVIYRRTVYDRVVHMQTKLNKMLEKHPEFQSLLASLYEKIEVYLAEEKVGLPFAEATTALSTVSYVLPKVQQVVELISPRAVQAAGVAFQAIPVVSATLSVATASVKFSKVKADHHTIETHVTKLKDTLQAEGIHANRVISTDTKLTAEQQFEARRYDTANMRNFVERRQREKLAQLSNIIEEPEFQKEFKGLQNAINTKSLTLNNQELGKKFGIDFALVLERYQNQPGKYDAIQTELEDYDLTVLTNTPRGLDLLRQAYAEKIAASRSILATSFKRLALEKHQLESRAEGAFEWLRAKLTLAITVITSSVTIALVTLTLLSAVVVSTAILAVPAVIATVAAVVLGAVAFILAYKYKPNLMTTYYFKMFTYYVKVLKKKFVDLQHTIKQKKLDALTCNPNANQEKIKALKTELTMLNQRLDEMSQTLKVKEKELSQYRALDFLRLFFPKDWKTAKDQPGRVDEFLHQLSHFFKDPKVMNSKEVKEALATWLDIRIEDAYDPEGNLAVDKLEKKLIEFFGLYAEDEAKYIRKLHRRLEVRPI